ncbi:hypothetical protein B296_00029119 [Ensete ventricosum]|uniref:Uncharacterized protein n=1 Tax=Ensete ventricosum TaxID=4639 RepID=A0A426ZZI1_ENSVE|nr:hypothetical protein B296_00029119 [Ensete ventricosum]
MRTRGGQPPCRADHPRPGRGKGLLQGSDRLRLGPARKGGRCRSKGQQPAREASCVGKSQRVRSYIPVFQIRMEKMKEVKRPPL